MNAVVDAIRTQIQTGRRWELPADTVRELLGIDHAEFYRRIYQEAMAGNPMLDVSTATSRFDATNVGELVTLLELFVGDAAERELERAGIFLSHETRFEITSRFLRTAGAAAAAHRPDREAFEAMLRRRGSYRRARGTYLDTYFSIPELIAQTADEVVAGRPFDDPEMAAASIRELLFHYFDRHVLERETVLAPVCVELFEIAVSAGYARRPEEERAEEQRAEDDAGRRSHHGATGDAGRRAAAPIRWAREVMELGTGSLTRSGLKTRYKELMKRYHPDVNPGGLRACQRINEAYSLLLASGVDSP